MHIDDSNKLLNTAILASILAGDEILNVYNSKEFNVEFKDDKSPLTQADKNAHNEIVRHLNKTGIPVLSEEGKHLSFSERKKWEYLWIVDPLDGTKEFIKKNGEFTVNIALVKNGKTLMGVIYAPVLKSLYYNKLQEGAYLVDFDFTGRKPEQIFEYIEKQKIKIPLKTRREYSVVASRSHLSDETKTFIEKLKEKHKKIEITSIGSSLKLCLLAVGQADIYPRFAPTMEWDIAAGHAILKAAGGNVLNNDTGQELQYNKENLLNPWFIAKTEVLYQEKTQ
ncbi:MAG: 3'(2'),5'-bisphosphate nucleotidase CysQ [Bacteroidales bacterium]|nr:3'(2'),5'-bisphosphate nucleotidase CysQ [Bacteroidales bacterium]